MSAADQRDVDSESEYEPVFPEPMQLPSSPNKHSEPHDEHVKRREILEKLDLEASLRLLPVKTDELLPIKTEQVAEISSSGASAAVTESFNPMTGGTISQEMDQFLRPSGSQIAARVSSGTISIRTRELLGIMASRPGTLDRPWAKSRLASLANEFIGELALHASSNSYVTVGSLFLRECAQELARLKASSERTTEILILLIILIKEEFSFSLERGLQSIMDTSGFPAHMWDPSHNQTKAFQCPDGIEVQIQQNRARVDATSDQDPAMKHVRGYNCHVYSRQRDLEACLWNASKSTSSQGSSDVSSIAPRFELESDLVSNTPDCVGSRKRKKGPENYDTKRTSRKKLHKLYEEDTDQAVDGTAQEVLACSAHQATVRQVKDLGRAPRDRKENNTAIKESDALDCKLQRGKKKSSAKSKKGNGADSQQPSESMIMDSSIVETEYPTPQTLKNFKRSISGSKAHGEESRTGSRESSGSLDTDQLEVSVSAGKLVAKSKARRRHEKLESAQDAAGMSNPAIPHSEAAPLSDKSRKAGISTCEINRTKEHTTDHFTIFVSNLSDEVDNQVLFQAFSTYGTVSEAYVIRDEKTGRSRGHGFAAFWDRAEAEKTLSSMNGERLGSRAIRCGWARPKVQ